ncbi:Adaptive-response sensory-kinase SasA [Dyadobacter sp. CECT 9275]|uniref:histidine kinase n=1 Tax=Dyadobacter helix TaxID=2822344 RepID=A0A916JA90_9BACT|nr:ATP-binding protein [Dyadobacter sp. CECT 9275]CAG4990401.1 Adaptive-response sensory-kinase SasA [Dyadobacter sp. CECT 9275]
MGDLIFTHDWTNTPLGTIDKWPRSLRTTLGIMLHSAFPMFLFWGKDRICFYNDAYRPSLGVSGKHPAIGKPAQEVWPEIWEFIGDLISTVYVTGVPQWFQDKLVPIYRNGRIEDVYWTFSYSPAYGDDGQIGGVLVTCMETTSTVLARKQIEETVTERTRELEQANASVRQLNAYLQDIINSFKQPLQVLEPVFEEGVIVDFRYRLTNQAYANCANTTPEAIQNKRVSEIFPGYLKTTSFSNVAKTYLSGETDTWMIHYDQDGLDLYNEMTAIKMENEVILHFADFTKLKYLEFELLKKITELENSNNNLEAFAHAASHDLKEPIRKIQIFSSRLRMQLAERMDERDLAMFNSIENASKRMSRMIDDLLLYAQFSMLPPEKEKVDLNVTIQQVLEDLEVSILETGTSVILADLPVVKVYGRQLHQMFQNLLSNSVKYRNPDVPLRIDISYQPRTEDGKPYHLIEVRDNGMGFEQEFAAKIFQLFTRLHNGGAQSGSGIGLSTVKKVIDNHNGMVRVESKVGIGTSFQVLLPVN